jgi:hypothetical protein
MSDEVRKSIRKNYFESFLNKRENYTLYVKEIHGKMSVQGHGAKEIMWS